VARGPVIAADAGRGLAWPSGGWCQVVTHPRKATGCDSVLIRSTQAEQHTIDLRTFWCSTVLPLEINRIRSAEGEGLLPSPSVRRMLAYGAVVALLMSLLPKCAGQSPSGQGAGNTWCPALKEACRQVSMAGQSAVLGTSVHTPAP